MSTVVPLSRFPLFDSTDPDEAEEQVVAALGPHKLTVREQASDFRARQNLATVANSSITYLEYDVPIESRAVMERSYLFFAMLEGHTCLRVDRGELDLAAGQGAIIVPERPFSLYTLGRASALMWKVSRTALERQAGLLTGNHLTDAVRFEPHVRLDMGKGPSLFHALRFVAGELQDASGIASSQAVQESMEQMLIRALLDTQPSQISEALACKGSRIAPRCVLRVERYLAEHLGEEITVSGMIEASGVSGRTMFSAFKKFRGISPMSFLRNLRMQQVRKDLVNAEPAMRVTDILMRRGITQFGRFAVAYKNIYGESPSQTIKR